MKTSPLAKRTLFEGGTIIDPVKDREYRGDVLVKNGKIAEVGKVQTIDAKVIDCTGLVLTHGFCDLHVHFREPGREDKETLQSGSRAALAGGFTRVCTMPNTTPPVDTPEALRFIGEKGAECPIYIHPIGAATKGQKGQELTEMGAMSRAGAVAFSDDGLPIMDASVMRRVLEYAGMLDKPVINHAEDVCLRSQGLMNEGPVATRLGLPGNPVLAESIMVHRDVQLATLTGAKLHVPHISTARAVEYVRSKKKQTDCISAEVAPHHLYFTDEDLVNYDTNLKVAPPIRNHSEQKALITGFRNGTIDCIATDHAPHTPEEKECTFDLAACGMIGLESCFGAVHKVLVKDNNVPLMQLIQALTVKPRQVMGFECNLLQPHTPAELTIFAPQEEWIFSTNDIYSKSVNSPFINRPLIGKIKYTIVKDQITTITI